MRVIDARFASTNLDLHGEQFSKETLDAMARALAKHYVPFLIGHDPRTPPVGRISSARLESTGGGHFVVAGTIDIWEPSDTPATLRGDGRSIAPAEEPSGLFDVLYDRTGCQEVGIEPFAELAKLAGKASRPKYTVKKAVDPLSGTVIASGVFVLGAIATGFLGKLGEDVYEKLKCGLKKLARPRREGDRLLVLQFLVRTKTRSVAVKLIATNPSPTDVDHLLNAGLRALDGLVEKALKAYPESSEIVVSWEPSKVSLLYTIRSDGVPSEIRPVSQDLLLSNGLSVSGHAQVDETDV